MDGLELIAHYLPLLAIGAGITLLLGALCVVGSSVVGVVIGALLSVETLLLKRTIGTWLVKRCAQVYVHIFRSIPPLILLFLVFFGLPQVLGFGFSSLVAAAIALIIFYGAYQAEIIRSGIEGIPIEQIEAASSLGFRTGGVLRKVLLPQAFRLALPASVAQWVATVKETSLASAIGVLGFTGSAMVVQQQLYSAVAIWTVLIFLAVFYLCLSFGVSRLGGFLEARVDYASKDAKKLAKEQVAGRYE